MLLAVHQNVADPHHVVGCEIFIGHARVTLEMIAAQGFVYVLEDDRAGHHEDVDEAVLDDVREQPPHTGRDQIARPANIDRRVVVEHVEPNAMRLGELTCPKSGSFHFLEQPGDRPVAVDRDRPRRNREKFRSLRFFLSHCH